jgi:protein-S-isoprenylcysteine O-methyltransferase Ste14
LREKVRLVLESLVTALLFGLQSIVYGDWAISVMAIPLLPYLVWLANDFMHGVSPNLEWDIYLLFFAREFMVGRIIAIVGVVIFLMAAFQFLRERAKGKRLIKTGLYSLVRHPQYFGIIIITIGLNVMVMVLTIGSNQLELIFLWLVQVAGYMILAKYEEKHLEKEFGEQFRRYKATVPFMLPIKGPSKIPETMFTLLIAVIIAFIFLTFPFNLLRLH